MKRAFIIHKWGGTPESDWYQWLRRVLEAKGIQAKVPRMPDTDYPRIEQWVPYLSSEVGVPDADAYLIGHSMGCQTILRYLERLNEGESIGGALFVAGFITLREGSLEQGQDIIVKPWLETPIDFSKARRHCKKFTSIFSDNDPYVPLEDSHIFKGRLKSKILIMPKGGHFTELDNYRELHAALNELLKMCNTP